MYTGLPIKLCEQIYMRYYKRPVYCTLKNVSIHRGAYMVVFIVLSMLNR